MTTPFTRKEKTRTQHLQPVCPKNPPKNRQLLAMRGKMKLILLIGGIFISSVVFSTGLNVPPVGNENPGGTIPFAEWNRTISLGPNTVLLKMLETLDGGIFVTGFYEYGLFFKKFATNGTELWHTNVDREDIEYYEGSEENDFFNFFHFDSNDVIFHLFQTTDGGFVMSWEWTWDESTFSPIIRLDEAGNYLWAEVIEGLPTPEVSITSDNGLIMGTGFNNDSAWYYECNYGEARPTFWTMLKLDEDGEEDWVIRDNSTFAKLLTILEVPEGGYLTLSEWEDKRIIRKLDQDGIVEWENTYEGWGESRLDDGPHRLDDGPHVLVNWGIIIPPIHRVNDGYIMHGRYRGPETDSSGKYLKLVKIDLQGELIWSQIQNLSTFGSETVDYAVPTADNGLLMTIYNNPHIPETILLKINETGAIEWTIEGTETQQYSSRIFPVTPERYLISRNIGGNDIGLFCIASNGSIVWHQVVVNSEEVQIKDIIAASGGGVILAGIITNEDWPDPWWANHDGIWLLKLNNSILSSGNHTPWINQQLGEQPQFQLVWSRNIVRISGFVIAGVFMVFPIYVTQRLRRLRIEPIKY